MCFSGERQSHLSSSVQGDSPQCAYQHGPTLEESYSRSSLVVPQENSQGNSRPRPAGGTKRNAGAHHGCSSAPGKVFGKLIIPDGVTAKSPAVKAAWIAFLSIPPNPFPPSCEPARSEDCLEKSFFLPP